MATSQNPNPHLENGLQTEQQQDQRNWADLSRDILLVIFFKLGLTGVIRRAGCVCRSWRKVAKEPVLFRQLRIMLPYRASLLMDPLRIAIDRSQGTLELFCIAHIGDDDLLQYISQRTSILKSLRLVACYEVSVDGLLKTIKSQPLLEELEIPLVAHQDNLPELIAKELPHLKHFKLNNYFFAHHRENNDVAFAIAKSMHELRCLELISNGLTNEGLKAILEGCPHLESLDIRECSGVNMDSDMLAMCAKLTTLRLPNDPLDDMYTRMRDDYIDHMDSMGCFDTLNSHDVDYNDDTD